MNPFEMVVLIVAIVTLGGVIRSKNGTRRSRRGTAPVEEQIENQILRSEIKDLKETNGCVLVILHMNNQAKYPIRIKIIGCLKN